MGLFPVLYYFKTDNCGKFLFMRAICDSYRKDGMWICLHLFGNESRNDLLKGEKISDPLPR